MGIKKAKEKGKSGNSGAIQRHLQQGRAVFSRSASDRIFSHSSRVWLENAHFHISNVMDFSISRRDQDCLALAGSEEAMIISP
eukprot:g54950.t1